MHNPSETAHDGPLGETVFEARQRLAAPGNRMSALETENERLRAENADLMKVLGRLVRHAPERAGKRWAQEVDHARFVLAKHGREAASHPQLSFSTLSGALAVAAPGANFNTRKSLKDAVEASMVPDVDRGGDRGYAGIGCYRLGRLGPDMVDGEYRCDGQRYPEPRRWRATVVVKSGRIVRVK